MNRPVLTAFFAFGFFAVRVTSEVAFAAASPFDGVPWAQVLAHDATMHVDADYTPVRGIAYYDGVDHVGGILYADTKAVIGRAGGQWLAAVPLASGGTIGTSGWLIYAAHKSRHIAVVHGTESLAFRGGHIVTVDANGPRVEGRGIETTYAVAGSTVTPIAKKSIALH